MHRQCISELAFGNLTSAALVKSGGKASALQVNQTGHPRRASFTFNATDASPVTVQCRLNGTAPNATFVGVSKLSEWEMCSSPKVASSYYAFGNTSVWG